MALLLQPNQVDPLPPERAGAELERRLLRRGVDSLAAHRDRCVRCRRTPLVGERVFYYGEQARTMVCELCRVLHREPPAASALVRSEESAGTVRVRDARK